MFLRKTMLMVAAASAWLGVVASASAGTEFYQQTNLVSDGTVSGTTKDDDLKNAWGLANLPNGPWWVANNATNTATVYDGTGAKQPLTVNVPGSPTGQVANSTSDFGGSLFIFDGEGGIISGWNGGNTAGTLVDNSTKSAIYKGLAIGSNGGSNFIYATDFHNAHIDVYGGDLKPATLGAGAFTDNSLPAGYAPFNIQNIAGKLYVTYALQDADKEDDSSGPGHGFVDVYDTAGTLLGRLVSNGKLDSPWGLAKAPANFGKFSNALLVGNFGDGAINAYNLTTGALLGTLSDKNGTPLSIEGLWSLQFADGGATGLTNQLFFTAGPGGEKNGLFGRIEAASGTTVPLPSMLYVLPFALLLAAVAARRMVPRAA
jgi:uncharacterized protein (TIGR03118 family)